MYKKIGILVFFGIIFAAFLLHILSIKTVQNSKLLSPFIEKGKIGSNLWFPKMELNSNLLGISFGSNQPLEITAKAAYFVDIDTGNILYQKNPHVRLPIASLTKIMTAVLTLENKSFSDKFFISSHTASMEPDHMQLRSGEILTVEELLKGLFLVSANDAAEALAENVFKNREEFISEMNKKAALLGMKDTLFINPSGLQEDGVNQYSTAYDVALMSRFAVKNYPKLVEITKSPHIFIPESPTHQDYNLYSGINLLTTYPGVLGFKTGYTPEAGLTLVTLASREGHTILGVLLASENRREEARELLDYSFKILGVEI